MSTREYFSYKTQVTGGTEIMAKIFHERVAPYLDLARDFNCVLLPGFLKEHTYESILHDEKQILLWLHNNPHEFLPPVDLTYFRKPELHKKIRKVITLSNYAANILHQQSGIPTEKIEVINYAVPTLQFSRSKFEDTSCIRMIWCKTPERGINIALEVLHVRKENFKLDIFGFECDEVFRASVDSEILQDERFVFHGRKSREVVLNYMENAHMFIYPATYYETFCVSLAEALSAGCISVYNNIGSLEEIGMNLGITYRHDDLNDQVSHRDKFNEALSIALETAYSGTFDPTHQVALVSQSFPLKRFITRWFELAAELVS